MKDEKDIFEGIKDDFQIKAQLNSALAFVHHLIHQSEHPEMLKYVRNRLKEPYIAIQTKLNKMGANDMPLKTPQRMVNR